MLHVVLHLRFLTFSEVPSDLELQPRFSTDILINQMVATANWRKAAVKITGGVSYP